MQLHYHDKTRITSGQAIEMLFNIYRAIERQQAHKIPDNIEATLKTAAYGGEVLTLEQDGKTLCTGHFDEFDK